ncbi:hypothetical protein F5876DRAFT_78608 [Lentinula aff. lateritia]|uniref:Uncharacterized protein n=1 Tax=Lentinula aff. lateritia TaxID=2804960 RepID=A0ACC1TV43_9AGAR|nr:hypothetical protein F5876DRAFT_78608 [Lentinula aff. lateritia]
MSHLQVVSNTSSKYVQTTNLNGIRPDLALKSSDSVLFYVHTNLLNSSSTNKFQGHTIPTNASVVNVPENSQILTIILDIIYRNASAAQDFAPPFPFDILVVAISRLSVYGVDVQAQLNLDRFNGDSTVPTQPVLQALYSHAMTHPLQLYILAAHYNLESLAIAASSHLLGLHITELTDEQAEAMGPVYLRRLILMQTQREEALKKILLRPPYPHPSTPDCDVLNQKILTRAWPVIATNFAWDIRADMPSTALERILSSLAGYVSCQQCKSSIEEQVARIIIEWESVKVTI